VVALSAGQYHTCALTAAGGVTCWGKNENGQLGDGQSCGIFVCTTPTDVVGLTDGVAAVASGGHHTCALTTSGGVKCWGWNRTGEVGDGTTTQRNTPVDVTELTSDVAAIAVGGRHTCALTTAGDVKCWGFNLYGEVGDGSTMDRSVPVDVVGLTGTPVALDAGFFHTCAQTATGGVQCWGRNVEGQVGDGQVCGSACAAPVNVSGLNGGVSAITTGFYHTCALTTAGAVRCWGRNFEGQIGDGTSDNIRTTPVDVVWLGPKPTPAPTATATPIPVGGIAERPEAARAPLQASGSSGPGAAMLASVTAGVLAGAAAIGGVGWYVRRRAVNG
jgi:alpha-tubulin suppressor-like RCC1 family protein